MWAAAKDKVSVLVLGHLQDRLDPAPESGACKPLALPGAGGKLSCPRTWVGGEGSVGPFGWL